MKELYYVWRLDNGKIANIAKRDKQGLYYSIGENKEWIEEPNLIRIEYEVTDYEKIDKEEAERLIKDL